MRPTTPSCGRGARRAEVDATALARLDALALPNALTCLPMRADIVVGLDRNRAVTTIRRRT